MLFNPLQLFTVTYFYRFLVVQRNFGVMLSRGAPPSGRWVSAQSPTEATASCLSLPDFHPHDKNKTELWICSEDEEDEGFSLWRGRGQLMNDKMKVCSQHAAGGRRDTVWGRFWRENGLCRRRSHLNTVNTAVQGIMGGQSEREQTGGLFMYSLKTEVIFSDLTTWLRPRRPEVSHDGCCDSKVSSTCLISNLFKSKRIDEKTMWWRTNT